MTSAAPFLAVLTLLLGMTGNAAALTYQETNYWAASDCAGSPFYMDFIPKANCEQVNATYDDSLYTFNGSQYYRTVTCVGDAHEWAKTYEMASYVMIEQFNATSGDCTEYIEGRVFLANESCVKIVSSTSYQSAIASVRGDGSLSLKLFGDNACSNAPATTLSIDRSTVANHSCYGGQYKFYSGGVTSDSYNTSTSGAGTLTELVSCESVKDGKNATFGASISTSSGDTSTGSGLGKVVKETVGVEHLNSSFRRRRLRERSLGHGNPDGSGANTRC
ncbi:hypothetical protein PHYPSEUDO_010329 [Phytophthora pseudosyringae]|uniref:TKL protein kinase n=1 Tax=Phytophthora pseudosyringae TaxID=221518 RepID=A0A8T1WAZ8_9STRA|nr:hypothetical protein PHYPSEUDO_010329 [Phytophthora pseudosyringae]